MWGLRNNMLDMVGYGQQLIEGKKDHGGQGCMLSLTELGSLTSNIYPLWYNHNCHESHYSCYRVMNKMIIHAYLCTLVPELKI